MHTNQRCYTIIAIVTVGCVAMFGFILGVFVFTQTTTAEKREQGLAGGCDLTSDVLRQTLSDVCTTGPLLDIAFVGNTMKCDVISSKKNTSRQPEVTFKSAQKDQTYTLFMVDPDAPGHSLEELNFWLHWAVTDIKGSDLKQGVMEGRELMEYKGPSPPSGIHRYQIIVFKSGPGFQLDKDTRNGFSLKDIDMCSIAGVFQFKIPYK